MTRFEIVRTPAGHHARFRATNGQIVWTTEVYARRRAAVRAVELITGATVLDGRGAWAGLLTVAHRNHVIEVRDVDERVRP